MKAPICLAALLLSATAATAQTVTIYEPVALPFEYTDAGVIKAQHIKPSDVTPEEYQRLLDEADKVRAFQMNTVSTGPSPEVTYESYVTPQTTPSMTQEVADATGTQATREHTVVKGDTLYNISKRYNVGVSQLQSSNQMTGNALSLGQVLRIPSGWVPTTSAPTVTVTTPSVLNTQPDVVLATTTVKPYAVVPGDTLYSISKRACVGVDAIRAVNGMGGNAIQPGQKLTLPGGHCLK